MSLIRLLALDHATDASVRADSKMLIFVSMVMAEFAGEGRKQGGKKQAHANHAEFSYRPGKPSMAWKGAPRLLDRSRSRPAMDRKHAGNADLRSPLQPTSGRGYVARRMRVNALQRRRKSASRGECPLDVQQVQRL
jgi:hypothetical protein